MGVRGLLQLTDEEPHAQLTLEAQEAARAAFAPAEECRDGLLNLRCTAGPACFWSITAKGQYGLPQMVNCGVLMASAEACEDGINICENDP